MSLTSASPVPDSRLHRTSLSKGLLTKAGSSCKRGRQGRQQDTYLAGYPVWTQFPEPQGGLDAAEQSDHVQVLDSSPGDKVRHEAQGSTSRPGLSVHPTFHRKAHPTCRNSPHKPDGILFNLLCLGVIFGPYSFEFV